MKAEFKGECTEVRKTVTDQIESEIRFLIPGVPAYEGDKPTSSECAIRIPKQLTFAQPVTVTLEWE